MKFVQAALDEDVVTRTEQSMGGEDFANYLTVTPGALFRLGANSGGGDLHSSSFKVNEAAIRFGIESGVKSVLGLLGAGLGSPASAADARPASDRQ